MPITSLGSPELAASITDLSATGPLVMTTPFNSAIGRQRYLQSYEALMVVTDPIP